MKNLPTRSTEFAPPERASAAEISRQVALLADSPLTSTLLNGTPGIVLILNEQRQIVFATRNVLVFSQGAPLESLYGLRPGEAFACIHAHEMPAGCGTSKFCAECGAVRAILGGLRGIAEVQECQLTRHVCHRSESLDLRINATPFDYAGEHFCLFALTDISHEKRRRALERIFFHDIINYAGGIEGLIEFIRPQLPPELQEDMGYVERSVHGLMDEIQSQKDLSAAENNELQPTFQPVVVADLLAALVRFYQKHIVAAGRQLEAQPVSRHLTFVSAPTLLNRVLGNLTKNALEACPAGQTVTLGCAETGDALQFWVHNPSLMSPAVRLQIFNRSFSTKGEGRGLGTYSVKLLTERYLGGTVTFTSEEGQGTRFTVTLPLQPQLAATTASEPAN